MSFHLHVYSYPSPRGVSYAHPTTPTPVSEPSTQLPNYTCMRGILVYLPMNWPANYAGQPAVVDTIQSKHTTLRLLNRPLEKLLMQSSDLLNITIIPPNPGDFVKMIGGQWAGCKGRLASANMVTGYDVELTNGQHVSIGAGHLAKYYGRGYLTVSPGSFPSSSSTSPSCSSQFAGYSTAYHSQSPHHHQLHTPTSPSPSTPTGTYSSSHPSFNFVTASNPQQSMCAMPYQCGIYQYPPRTSAPPQYTCSQSPTHMPFMRGMMEIKKQIMTGSCKPPQNVTKLQQRQKIVNSVDKVLEALVKRSSPTSFICSTTPDGNYDDYNNTYSFITYFLYFSLFERSGDFLDESVRALPSEFIHSTNTVTIIHILPHRSPNKECSIHAGINIYLL